MTDKETLLKMLAKLATPVTAPEDKSPWLCSESTVVVQGNDVWLLTDRDGAMTGYSGFYTIFSFTDEGELDSVEIGE